MMIDDKEYKPIELVKTELGALHQHLPKHLSEQYLSESALVSLRLEDDSDYRPLVIRQLEP